VRVQRARPGSNRTIDVGGGIRASAVKAGRNRTPHRQFGWRGVLRDNSGVVWSCPHDNHPRYEAINCAARHAHSALATPPGWRPTNSISGVKVVLGAAAAAAVLLGASFLWPSHASTPQQTAPIVHPQPFRPLPIFAASARCVDGTLSYSQHHSGTCSHHHGVAAWLQPKPPTYFCPAASTLQADGLCHWD
jgi:hypothetical protein